MARNGKFLFGAVLGALLGLAFAPKKGSELRKELKTEIKKGGYGEETFAKNARLIGDDVAATAQEVIEDPTVQEHIEKVKKEGGKVLNQAKEHLEASGEEWMEIARDRIMDEKKHLEKEGGKAVHRTFDNIKRKLNQAKHDIKSASKKGKSDKKS